MIVASLNPGWVVAIIAVVTITATAVASFLRVRGDTREGLEHSTEKRVAQAQESAERIVAEAEKRTDAALKTANEWRENYTAERQLRVDSQTEAKEQRALKHDALAEVAQLRLVTDLSTVMSALSQQSDLITKLSEHLDQQTVLLTGVTELVATISTRLEQLG